MAALLTAVAVGLVIGRTGPDRVPAKDALPQAPGVAPSVEIAELRQALEQESFAREMLAAELELMRTVLEQLAEERLAGPAASEQEPAGASEPASQPSGSAPPRGDIDEGRLAEIGLSEGEILDLRERWDHAQLARLELNDRAAREGYLFRPRHRQQIAAFEAELRADLGEVDYDRMLYATDQPNRVRVSSVIGGSAAARAGLQPGDVIWAYGADRVFAPRDLRDATQSGVRGETVRVVVDRNGQRVSAVVPRGPLGVRMSPEKEIPTR